MICESCIHFKQSEKYNWGLCGSPLPWWSLEESPTIFLVDDNHNCELYRAARKYVHNRPIKGE
jgi:hypothetical protein